MEYPRVVIENVLGAVGMVSICIHNGHPEICPQAVAEMINHDGFIVQHTKTPGPMHKAVSMVPWRPEQGKGAIHCTIHHQIRSHYGPPRRCGETR